MSYEIRPGIRRAFRLALRRRDLIDEQMDEELRFHLEARVQQLVRQGLPLDVARAEARRRLTMTPTEQADRLRQVAQRKERRMAMREWIEDVLFDVRYAARGMLRRPGFTAIAVLTLAIGIGANTAIFSAVNALLLRPLPFRAPDQLMDIALVSPGNGGPTEWSFSKFGVFRDAQRSFSDVALWSTFQFNLTDGNAERVSGEWVTARYLGTLGVTPFVGRDLTPELDRQPGTAERLVLISHALWSRRFNADPSAVGKTVSIDGQPFTVIGVVPADFGGLSGRSDIYVPVTTRDADQLGQAWSLEFSMIGRRRADVSAVQATSEAVALGKRVYEASPMTNGLGSGAKGGWSATARPLDETRVAPMLRRSLLVLFGAVGFVLLIACVNLANLLLSRATSRKREIAVRLALGARRARLVRLLVTESLLLSLTGAMVSILIAWWGTRALSTVNSQGTLAAQGLAGLGVVGFSSIRLDITALLFTLGIALGVGLLFGLAPALRATRASLQGELKGGAVTVRTGWLRGLTSRRVLVVTEVALALVLLAGAGLMMRSLGKLLGVDAGFDPRNVLSLRLSVSPGEVPRDSLPGFYDVLIERMQGLPGVQSVGLADCPPLNGGCNGTIITFPDRPPVPPGEAPSIGVHVVTPGWFGTMRVPLKRGRLLDATDRLGGPKAVVISESAARKYWPNEDPIGKRAAVYQGGFHTGATVVGVVGDVRFGTVDSMPVPDVYMSYFQSPRSRMMIFMRTAGDPQGLAAATRRLVTELSPRYPAYDIRTMEDRVASASAQARLSAVLLALFAGVALVLSVVGIYGVMSFAVVQRTREIGIRIALGADRQRVLGLVVREGLALAAVGAIIGLGTALALSRVLASLLYDVAPTDPLTYFVIVVLLGGAAAAASWIPARRATRVNPTEALRSE